MDQPIVSQASAHFGEESPLVGYHGSGTIFFSSCNLKCLYCQNYDISHLKQGRTISHHDLALLMLRLQDQGCHNINLVTPTHVIASIISALVVAVDRGLKIPIIYNCGGYESADTLRLLDGIIDIYMPDIKYSSNRMSKKYSGVDDYWEVVRKAISEMYRQVGVLEINNRGIARRGLLIRHLVLPSDIAGSKAVLDFIAGEISIESYVNIMDQYRPSFRAYQHPQLNRPITAEEYDQIVKYARNIGLHRGFS
jgi:putative pyruvate formate lyase activating enzyme